MIPGLLKILALRTLTLYNGLNFRVHGKLNNSDEIMKNVFWIGTQPSLTNEMKEFVVDNLKKIFD